MSRAPIHAPVLLTLALLAACGPGGEADPDALGDEAICVDDDAFFRDQLWPGVLSTHCANCHTATGLAASSDLVLESNARPDYLAVNAARLADVAAFEREGQSIALRKPLGLDDHGGGAVLEEGDEGFALLTEFVARQADPVTCGDGPGDATDADEGLVLDSPVATLRKATLTLAGRLPTAAEVSTVRAGGEPALVTVLWQVMSEEAFAERMMEMLNDEFLTDRYLRSRDGIGIFDDDTFPGVYWYESAYGDDYDDFRRETSYAIAREPLQLAAHIVRHDLPWTELLTADYTMVNAYTRQAYGLGGDWPDPDDPAALAFEPVQVPGYGHAGLLTTPAFLNRFPTTATNRNRHRAWMFFDTFLATDVLTLADRPLDPTTSEIHNPTYNDPQCSVCHAVLDPVAGAFQNWDDEGRFRPPEEGWHPEMFTPGFGETELPSSSRPQALQWLAQQAVADPRFGVATVRMMLHALTGLDLLTPPLAGDDPVRLEAMQRQDAFVEGVAGEFVARDHDIKYVVEQIVLSRYFRASAVDEATPATEGQLHHAGTARLLGPEQLNRKIMSVTGLPWRPNRTADDFLLDEFQLLYGGIDSFGVTERLRDPNGIMGAIGIRMAMEMSCEAVPRDFILPPHQRRLFPLVEPTWAPETPDGFAVPEAERLIRENIQHLHAFVLGEDLALDDPEIDATYALFHDVWKEGRDLVASGEVDDRMPSECRATADYWTGVGLPDELELTDDDDHLVRAWMTVVAYLLADFHFLHE